MNVTRFESPNLPRIALVRNAAGDLSDMLSEVQKKTVRAREDAIKAKSTERLLLAYARWLSAWHSAHLAVTWDMHFSGHHVTHGRHAVSSLQIKGEIRHVDNLIAGKAHWIAVPNLEATRRNVLILLSQALVSIDNAIQQCAILSGVISEGKSA